MPETYLFTDEQNGRELVRISSNVIDRRRGIRLPDNYDSLSPSENQKVEVELKEYAEKSSDECLDVDLGPVKALDSKLMSGLVALYKKGKRREVLLRDVREYPRSVLASTKLEQFFKFA